MAVRILVADDHEIVIDGIRTLIGRSGRDWEICGEARNGKEAVSMIRSLNPDIAVLDITMPEMSGLQAAREVTRTIPAGCRLLMFTMHDSPRLGNEAREAGAHGYVLKSQASRDLIRAIDYLIAGNTFFGAPPEPAKEKDRDKNPGLTFCGAFAFA
jgi:DNA-binding NarL/FixJ family response regulator